MVGMGKVDKFGAFMRRMKKEEWGFEFGVIGNDGWGVGGNCWKRGNEL